ncbi:MAG: hypothetical protein HY826_08825 [Actinobacteria bacterium]|nr:hypothetical protein [Actinomycetota bacterium]
MNLFRSEEHVHRWLDGRQPGITLSLGKLSELANAWWSDRLNADWRPRSRNDGQAILTTLGLVGDFWTLP